jgi:hypothetical protein
MATRPPVAPPVLDLANESSDEDSDDPVLFHVQTPSAPLATQDILEDIARDDSSDHETKLERQRPWCSNDHEVTLERQQRPASSASPRAWQSPMGSPSPPEHDSDPESASSMVSTILVIRLIQSINGGSITRRTSLIRFDFQKWIDREGLPMFNIFSENDWHLTLHCPCARTRKKRRTEWQSRQMIAVRAVLEDELNLDTIGTYDEDHDQSYPRGRLNSDALNGAYVLTVHVSV